MWDRAHEPAPNPAKVSRSFDELRRLLPRLPELAIARRWAGYIDATPDLLPVLGAVAAPRGFVFATGFSGHGVMHAPATGQVLAELLTGGSPVVDISPLRWSRFQEGDLITETHVI